MSNVHVRYLLLGGGVASSAAAMAIRRIDHDSPLLVVGQEVNRPYTRPKLTSDYLLGRIDRQGLLTVPADVYDAANIPIRTGRRAVGIELARSVVLFDDGQEVAYEKLLLAVGAKPRSLDIPGADLPGVYALRTIEDADRLRAAIASAKQFGQPHPRGRGRVTVIGAGLLGCELADALTDAGLAVELVSAGSLPLTKQVGEVIGKAVRRQLEENGIGFHGGVRAMRLEGDGRARKVVLADETCVNCDFVVTAIGVLPRRELLRGTAIRAERAILVDQRLATSVPNVFAAGDCAAVFDPRYGKHRFHDHYDAAEAFGIIAGHNMAGLDEPADVLGGFATTIRGLSLRSIGEPRLVARRIIRASANAGLAEIGLDREGKVAAVAIAGTVADEPLLATMVERRWFADPHADALREPGTDLRPLLELPAG